MDSNNEKGVFHMTTTAQRWGNSIGIRIPQNIAKKHGVVNGTQIKVVDNGNNIVLKPINDYTLTELLEKCTPDRRHKEIDFGVEGRELF